jgi:hypothetical protein
MKKKAILPFLFVVIWTIITILATTWGSRFDWPDNVHVDHGFPFVWSTQTLSTISGAVNIWIVDITALTMNLILWLGIMLIVSAALMYLVKE